MVSAVLFVGIFSATAHSSSKKVITSLWKNQFFTRIDKTFDLLKIKPKMSEDVGIKFRKKCDLLRLFSRFVNESREFVINQRYVKIDTLEVVGSNVKKKKYNEDPYGMFYGFEEGDYISWVHKQKRTNEKFTLFRGQSTLGDNEDSYFHFKVEQFEKAYGRLAKAPFDFVQDLNKHFFVVGINMGNGLCKALLFEKGRDLPLKFIAALGYFGELTSCAIDKSGLKIALAADDGTVSVLTAAIPKSYKNDSLSGSKANEYEVVTEGKELAKEVNKLYERMIPGSDVY